MYPAQKTSYWTSYRASKTFDFTVCVHEAKLSFSQISSNYSDVPGTGPWDTKVVVTLPSDPINERHETSRAGKTPNPVWDQAIVFNGIDYSEVVRVEVRGMRKLGDNPVLASMEFEVHQVMRYSLRENASGFNLKCDRSRCRSGEIVLSFNFDPPVLHTDFLGEVNGMNPTASQPRIPNSISSTYRNKEDTQELIEKARGRNERRYPRASAAAEVNFPVYVNVAGNFACLLLDDGWFDSPVSPELTIEAPFSTLNAPFEQPPIPTTTTNGASSAKRIFDFITPFSRSPISSNPNPHPNPYRPEEQFNYPRRPRSQINRKNDTSVSPVPHPPAGISCSSSGRSTSCTSDYSTTKWGGVYSIAKGGGAVVRRLSAPENTGGIGERATNGDGGSGSGRARMRAASLSEARRQFGGALGGLGRGSGNGNKAATRGVIVGATKAVSGGGETTPRRWTLPRLPKASSNSNSTTSNSSKQDQHHYHQTDAAIASLGGSSSGSSSSGGSNGSGKRESRRSRTNKNNNNNNNNNNNSGGGGGNSTCNRKTRPGWTEGLFLRSPSLGRLRAARAWAVAAGGGTKVTRSATRSRSISISRSTIASLGAERRVSTGSSFLAGGMARGAMEAEGVDGVVSPPVIRDGTLRAAFAAAGGEDGRARFAGELKSRCGQSDADGRRNKIGVDSSAIASLWQS